MGDFFFTKRGLERALDQAREGTSNEDILRQNSLHVMMMTAEHDPPTVLGTRLQALVMEMRQGTPVGHVARSCDLGWDKYLRSLVRKLKLDYTFFSNTSTGKSRGEMNWEEAKEYVGSYEHLKGVAIQHEQDFRLAMEKKEEHIFFWLSFYRLPTFLGVHMYLHTKDAPEHLLEEHKLAVRKAYEYGMSAEYNFEFNPRDFTDERLQRMIDGSMKFWDDDQ